MIDVKEGFLYLCFFFCVERENNVFDEVFGDIGVINCKYFLLFFF